jgi:type II secretory pathway pseudopilin PulG
VDIHSLIYQAPDQQESRNIMSASKFLLNSLLKQPRRAKGASGFTLIELLVALALTFLIITPLLGLVVSLMSNDRQEQAKVASQQEIQAALDYMAQDLQQAVYIYDATALSKTSPDGINDQIPPYANAVGGCQRDSCVPVLAFWKRKFLDREDTINGVKIKDLADSSRGSDRYVYSLVVYYLIKDNTNGTWSQASRVGRFEVRDGIIDPANRTQPPTRFLLPPDDGFARFDSSTSSSGLHTQMNKWEKGDLPYTQPVEILIDYIDDTKLAEFPNKDPLKLRDQFTPPPNDVENADGFLNATQCKAQTGEGAANAPGSSRVPPQDIIPAELNTGSFYACVNPVNAQGQSVAQIYLRGNALPRLSKDPTTWKVTASNQETMLGSRPVAKVRVAVRSLLGGKKD